MMNVMLRKIMPVGAVDGDVVVEEEDEYNGEYSFAMEYKGPLVGYEIPQVVPVDVERIPVAAAVVNDEALMRDFRSVPVVQPVLKRVNGGRMCLKESEFVAAKLVEIQRYGSGKEEDDGEDFGLDGDLVHRNRRKGVLGGDRVDDVDGESGVLGVVQGLKHGELDAVKSSARGGSGSANSLMGVSEDQSVSCRLSGSSDAVEAELPCESENEKGLENFVIQSSSSSGGRSLSRSISLETYSCGDEEQDHDEETVHERKPSVKFQDGEPIDIDYVEYGSEDDESLEVRQVPAAERKGKKGSCYRCFKGKKWMKKEVCLVCGAKFCGKCLLKMMGDMSEGRKCITCIGFPIEQSRRGNLGKPSWLLKRLLTEEQLKQVMTYELTSEANQLIPELVSVNGKPLSYEEMSILQSCKWPPKGLKPGEYWYDKVSGLWGKVSY